MFKLNKPKTKLNMPKIHIDLPNDVEENKLFYKLTRIMCIILFAIVCLMIIRGVRHAKIMNDAKIPEDAVVDAGIDNMPTDYVNEVTYNPAESAKKYTDSQNQFMKTRSRENLDLHDEPLWYLSSEPCTWYFMSGYDYNSARIDCVWICTFDETGEIAAFHVAEYNGTTDTFDNSVTRLTKKGGLMRAHD